MGASHLGFGQLEQRLLGTVSAARGLPKLGE